jgi:hypothetical protein
LHTRLLKTLRIAVFSLLIVIILAGCNNTATLTTTTTTTETSTLATEENYYGMKLADEAFFTQLDNKADEMRAAILASPSVYETSGTTYYVSNSGDDANNGLSPETAWATIAKVNNSPIPEGSKVLFERGGIWREQILAKDGVTYSAYGEGEKPKLYGSMHNYAFKNKWLSTEYPNIYMCADSFEKDVGIIIFNHGEAWGIRKMQYVDYFIDINDLVEDLNFYYNAIDKRVYLYSSGGNPAERFSSIEIGDRRHGIVLTNQRDVTIDNLCLKYWGAHGIAAGGLFTENLTVRNCEFGWIGGTLLDDASRYGNAVEVWSGCNGYTVENCYIYQIYDAGITHQFRFGGSQEPAVEMHNVLYKNNLIEYCTYSIEYFLTHDNHPDAYMENILIQGNFCRFSGYGWGDQRPQKDTAAHLRGWDHDNRAINFIVENNIFDRGKYHLIYIGAASVSYLPVMRNNTYVNEIGSSLGGYGQRPATYYLYDINVGKIIQDILKDEGAEVYYFINQP